MSDKFVSAEQADDAIRYLEIELNEKQAQLKAVKVLYGPGLMEHSEVIRYTKAIREHQ